MEIKDFGEILVVILCGNAFLYMLHWVHEVLLYWCTLIFVRTQTDRKLCNHLSCSRLLKGSMKVFLSVCHSWEWIASYVHFKIRVTYIHYYKFCRQFHCIFLQDLQMVNITSNLFSLSSTNYSLYSFNVNMTCLTTSGLISSETATSDSFNGRKCQVNQPSPSPSSPAVLPTLTFSSADSSKRVQAHTHEWL